MITELLTTSNIDISIVIVSYNTQHLLKNCLTSVLAFTCDVRYEVIVVDNKSTDNSVDLVKNQFSEVILIESDKNLGFGGANNLGIKRAKGKYIFLLNSDTIIIDNVVKQFYEFMERPNNLKIASCGGLLLNEDSSLQISHGNFPSIQQIIFDFGFSKIFPSYYSRKLSLACTNVVDSEFEVDYISGAALFIRKTSLDLCGSFDERFFLYFEETEMQFRFKKQGFKNVILSSSKIIHLGGMSTPSDWKIKLIEKSKILFWRICYGKTHALLAKSLLTLNYLFFLIIRSNKSKWYSHLRAAFKA